MDVFPSFSPPHFVVFPEKDLVFYIRFFPVSEFGSRWKDEPSAKFRMTSRDTATNLGTRKHRFLCVRSPKTLSLEPSLPPRKWPSFLSLEEAFVILSFLLNFLEEAFISAQACLLSGASQTVKKKHESFLAAGSFWRGAEKATSPYHFWLGDLFRWTKMAERSVLLLSFGFEICSGLFTEQISQMKFPQKTTEQNTFPSVLLSFVPFRILFVRLAEKFSVKLYERQSQSISRFHQGCEMNTN